jgi:hypothetical protein
MGVRGMSGRCRMMDSDKQEELGVVRRGFEGAEWELSGIQMSFAVDARQRWCSRHLGESVSEGGVGGVNVRGYTVVEVPH